MLPLRGNFRSSAPVVAAANQIGRTLLAGFQELTCGRDEPAPAVELLLTLEEGKAKGARTWKAEEIELEPPPSVGQPAIFAEALALAERLRELVEAGEAEAGEIVVLLRAFTHVDAYEEALRRFGLDPYVMGGRGYWSQQQVEDLLRLLSCVANPLDDEMLFGALAAPRVGVSPDSLWLLRGGRRRAPRLAGPRPRLRGRGHRAGVARGPSTRSRRRRGRRRAPARFLRDARRPAGAGGPDTLDSLVEATMDTFGYDLALLARKGGRGRMANVRKLMRLASEYERNRGPRPPRLPRPGRAQHRARRARGHGAGQCGGPRRRPDHDRARGQGARVPGRRGAGHGAQAERGPSVGRPGSADAASRPASPASACGWRSRPRSRWGSGSCSS